MIIGPSSGETELELKMLESGVVGGPTQVP